MGWKSPWAKTKPLEVISDAASPSTAQVGSNAPPSSQATKPESMKRSAGDAGIELKPTEPGTKVESTPENEKKSSRSKKSGLKNTENGDEPKLDESGTANL